ncbi:MAG TPA: tungsten ABC transporter substrate-binding protein [Gammaproteobacteria bacterium]|nr:tungsten ABC transporter substrate-binding protein [Gammaproteobacteria bacterium]
MRLTTLKNVLLLIICSLLPVTVQATGIETNAPIRLATTTSTENSGLLQHLLPAFERDTGYRVHVIAVGTGKALRMGQDGDVDAVLVHAPAAEQSFVDAGYGVQRHDVMYNDFIIVGPANDPAAVSKSHSGSDALARIADNAGLFISRGDDSGTNKKELLLWKDAGIKPQGSWYREAGQGMGKVLQMAAELSAYTLTDRGTWLSLRDKLPLRLAYQGDPSLFNPYGIIAVNPSRYPDINHSGAQALINWITSTSGQQLIGSYTVANSLLFTPSANSGQFALDREKPSQTH